MGLPVILTDKALKDVKKMIIQYVGLVENVLGVSQASDVTFFFFFSSSTGDR